jgi:hypothetical protein
MKAAASESLPRENKMAFWELMRHALERASEGSHLIDIDKKSNQLIDEAWSLPSPIVAPKVKKMVFSHIKDTEYLAILDQDSRDLKKYVNEHDLSVRKMVIYLMIYDGDRLMPERFDLVYAALQRLIQRVNMDLVSSSVQLSLKSQGFRLQSAGIDC